MRRNCNNFIFFWLLRHFLLWWMDANFWARPLKIAHGFFFRPFYCVLDAFLKKRMALPIWTSCVRFVRNIERRLWNRFLLEHRRLEDVILGAPSEDRPQETECMWRMLSRSSFGSLFSGYVPEETHIDADNDWKTTRSSKGKTDICLCSNC